MKKYVVLLASLLTSASMAYAEEPAAKPDAKPAVATEASQSDYVIMKVGTDEVKRSEIEKVWKIIFPGGNAPDFDTLDTRIKNNLLRGVANEHILLKEAKKSTISESPDVKDRLRTAENQVLIQEFVRDKVKDSSTDDKLKTAYDQELKNRPAGQEEVSARHILVKTEADAKALVKKLRKGGADFAALAKEKSEDKASGAAGGDLGWFTADRMTPEFSKAVFAMKKGEISEPVKTDFGWHVIKMEDRRVAPPPAFDAMKEQLKAQLQRQAVNDYIQEITKDVQVTVIDSKGMEKPLPPEPPMPVAPAAGGAAPAPAGE